MDMWARLKDLPTIEQHKKLEPYHGTFFNKCTNRLEKRSGEHLICFIDISSLNQLAMLDDERIKNVISKATGPLATMLADFFFSGWRLSYYIKTGDLSRAQHR